MSLFVAELRRLSKRRFAQLMAVLVVLLLATVVAIMAATHYKPGPEARARAEARAAAQYEEDQRWLEQGLAQCEAYWASEPTEVFPPWPEDCEEIRTWLATPEQMVEWYMPPTFEFSTRFKPMNNLFAGLLAMAAFVVGASFIGAEWRSGGMTNLLLWRPRRRQVLTVKLAALLAVLFGSTVLLAALWTGAFWLVAVFRGVTNTMTSGAWQSIALAELRGLVMVLAAGTAGFALASLGRHTAAAMGAAIGSFVIGVAGVFVVFAGMLELRYWEAWLWVTYVRAWMNGSVRLTDFNAPCGFIAPGGDCVQPALVITWPVAGLGIAGVLLLMLFAAMWHIRHRDVT